ncbi:unnamed protein product [Arctogadus glacialis]
MNLKKPKPGAPLTSDDEGGKEVKNPFLKAERTVPADEGEKHTDGIMHSCVLWRSLKALHTLVRLGAAILVMRFEESFATSSQPLRAEFNWLGRGGKKLAFASYKVCNAVRGPQQFSLPPPSPSPVMDDTTSSDSDDDCSSLE